MSLATHHDVLIVGAGHGGAQLAIALRQRRFGGTVGIIGAEPDVPYERPPLSKDYLSGERQLERLRLRPESFWGQSDISLRLGSTVLAVNPTDRTVSLQCGDVVHYGVLVWAAGGRPRTLTCPGADLQGVLSLRTRNDVDTLRHALVSADHIAIVGGGYIGLESAATLRKLGKQVTVIEALDRVLARVAGESLSRFYEAEHRAHGVRILVNSTVECIEGAGTRACGVRIKGGQVVAADLVIVGIGIAPACEPLIAAGAIGDNGVLVDEYGRTSLPDIYALGDCAKHANAYADGTIVRLESVQNAADMAVTVAKAITGELEPYRSVPWFWSNQYDLRLQTIGLSSQHDDAVLRGDPATRRFSIVYRRHGRVIALDCVNSPKDFIHGRALVQNRITAESIDLADTQVSLKDLNRAR